VPRLRHFWHGERGEAGRQALRRGSQSYGAGEIAKSFRNATVADVGGVLELLMRLGLVVKFGSGSAQRWKALV
jgi:hypothetical protein